MGSFLKNRCEQESDELEALQTDVMRFMAIIAFCLLVIFIPLAKEIPEVSEKTQEIIQENIDLKEQLKNLLKKIANLESEVDNLAKETKKSKEYEAEINDLKEKILTQKAKTEKLKTEKLTKIKVEKQTKEVKQTEKKLKDLKEKVTKEKSKKKPKEKSSIKFADDSLVNLVKKDKVNIYLHTSNQLFKVKASVDRLKFVKVDKLNMQANTYFMPQNNVPSHLINSFKRVHSNLLEKNWKLYIVLDNNINKNLQKLLLEDKGGIYLINSDGSIANE